MTRIAPLFTSVRPEPAHFWIRQRPRSWPGDGLPWLDLAAGGVSFGGSGLSLSSPEGWPRGDGVYLPPLDEEYDDDLRRFGRLCASPPVVQRRPGCAGLGAAVTEVWDPLVPLLRQEEDWVEQLPRGATVAWPLLPGDATSAPDEEVWRRLVEQGVACVQFVAARLGPETTRRLCEELELPDAVWDALFHGRVPEARDWARGASAAGLSVAMRRPPLRGDSVRREETNRRVAESLAWAGELASRMALGDALAQSYFRAARHLDDCSWDVESLWREGNLGVLPWLEPAARELVEEGLAGREGELERLWCRYLEDEP